MEAGRTPPRAEFEFEVQFRPKPSSGVAARVVPSRGESATGKQGLRESMTKRDHKRESCSQLLPQSFSLFCKRVHPSRLSLIVQAKVVVLLVSLQD